MSLPPSPTPPLLDRHKCAMTASPTVTPGLREEPVGLKQATVCCNVQTVLLVMTLVNTALLCIVLGFLIGHR